jgi:hypothetical protein
MAVPVALAASALSQSNNNNNNQKDRPSLLDRLLQFGLIAGVLLIVALVIAVGVIGYYVLPTITGIAEGGIDLLQNLLDPSGKPTSGEFVVSLLFPPYFIYNVGARILG